jgi:hypothetical protein
VSRFSFSVGHEIEDHLQPFAMRFSDQVIEILQRAKDRIDAAVIGDVVAEVAVAQTVACCGRARTQHEPIGRIALGRVALRLTSR